MLTDSSIAAPKTVHTRRSLLEWPFGVDERPYAASLSGQPVLLPFDGSVEAQAAARVADAIAGQLHATVNVVSIIDTTPVPIPFPLDLAIGIAGEGVGGTIHHEQERRSPRPHQHRARASGRLGDIHRAGCPGGRHHSSGDAHQGGACRNGAAAAWTRRPCRQR